jgi:hypothetical protein
MGVGKVLQKKKPFIYPTVDLEPSSVSKTAEKSPAYTGHPLVPCVVEPVLVEAFGPAVALLLPMLIDLEDHSKGILIDNESITWRTGLSKSDQERALQTLFETKAIRIREDNKLVLDYQIIAERSRLWK